MLKDADLKLLYTSGEADEPSCFMFDALSNSIQFDLALGYFRSTGFSTLALGFSTFIINGGSMRFIINNSLTTSQRIIWTIIILVGNLLGWLAYWAIGKNGDANARRDGNVG